MGHGIRIFGVLVGILRHFQTLFCGVVGTEKNLVGEGYNEAPGFGFSRPQFVRGFYQPRSGRSTVDVGQKKEEKEKKH